MDLSDYNSKNLSTKIIWFWLVIFVFVVLAFVYINQSFKYREYKYLSGRVIDDEKILFLVSISDIKSLRSLSTIYISNKNFAYEIFEIYDEKVLIEGHYFYEIILLIKNDFLEDEFLEGRLLVSQEKILTKLLKQIMEVN